MCVPLCPLVSHGSQDVEELLEVAGLTLIRLKEGKRAELMQRETELCGLAVISDGSYHINHLIKAEPLLPVQRSCDVSKHTEMTVCLSVCERV